LQLPYRRKLAPQNANRLLQGFDFVDSLRFESMPGSEATQEDICKLFYFSSVFCGYTTLPVASHSTVGGISRGDQSRLVVQDIDLSMESSEAQNLDAAPCKIAKCLDVR
jgi:hypothetical protein